MNFQPDCPGPGAVWLFWRGENFAADENSPSHLAALNASPLWDGALGMAAKASG